MASSLDTFIDSDTFGGSRVWSFVSTSTAIFRFKRWLGRRQSPETQRAKSAEALSFCVWLTAGIVGVMFGLICIATLWLIGI